MSTKIVNLEEAKGGTALAPADLYDPFAAYGNSVTNRAIVGQLLKFSKGDWLAGEDQEEIPVGTRLVANMDTLSIGWVKWEDNKPSEQIMGLVKDMFKPPRRSELGDQDEDQWEVGTDGKARDPWQFSNYLILKAEGEGDGEENLYTFATSSKGGLGAIGELCKTYSKVGRMKPDQWPVVELQVDSYLHPNKEFGRIKYPIFEVVDWEAKDIADKVQVKKVPAKKPAPKPAPKKAASRR